MMPNAYEKCGCHRLRQNELTIHYFVNSEEIMARTIGLSNEEITTLRDALNLAAEYIADMDDEKNYTQEDRDKIDLRIGRFRLLDSYLKKHQSN
jgi:hypothetical protein